MDKKFADFINLSAAITGFSRVDLEGTGVTKEYYTTLRKEASAATTNALLKGMRKSLPNLLKRH